MKLESQREIAAVLNKLPMVMWDRYTSGEYVGVEYGYFNAYGWIKRDDGRADFVLITIQLDEKGAIRGDYPVSAVTSSAEYSREIQRILQGDDEGHIDCQRIDTDFGALVENKAISSA